jgi:peptide/nickel transport system permease protein
MSDIEVKIPQRISFTQAVWERVRPILLYLRRNPVLIAGLSILLLLFLFVLLGYIFYDVSRVDALSVPANQLPSKQFPFGTDRQGRDILAVIIVGTPLTLRIGLIAGAVGVFFGMILGFVSAYSGGWLDGVIKTFVDILLTVPQLLVLVLIAVSIPRGGLTVDQMALAVAVLAWRWPARTVRSQVLVMREAPYVQIAKLSGMSDIGIIFKEMMPNLAPYVFASFVSAVAAGILASIGLEALGLGPLDSPTLGMTIYWNIWYSSILHGWWWWLLPPIIVIILLFVGLFMITAGLDEVANPRLRRRV